ncbi:Type I phosphodiesterase / nucleotide pyrophosphatase [compost metagenome]
MIRQDGTLSRLSLFNFFCIMSIFKIKFPFLAVLVFGFTLSSFAQIDTVQQVNLKAENSILQQQKPYVVLISIDGFRWDLADKYKAKNLLALREKGVQAEYMQSSFPSLTFPNHYTIVTGLYPAHHGVVDNIFYDKTRAVLYRKSDKKMAVDSSWYKGKPLWILAEEQQMLSAVFYWPGSEISMNGIRPTYYYNYNETIPVNRRVAIMGEWFRMPPERRPHFFAVYFPQVDKAAHRFTAESEQTRMAVQEVDEAIGKLVELVGKTGLPVNFVVVSDHGMTAIDRENTIPLPKVLQGDRFIVPPGNAMLHVYARDKKDIKPVYRSLKATAKNYTVYRSSQIPKAWNYNRKEDWYKRVGDLILIPQLPNVFSVNGIKPDPGQHGFDPAIPDMHAVFYAWGPQLKEGAKIPAFENVHVYPFIARLLGLDYTHKIDGKEKVLLPLIK